MPGYPGRQGPKVLAQIHVLLNNIAISTLISVKSNVKLPSVNTMHTCVFLCVFVKE